MDRSDVLRAKRKALKRAGAAFSQQENKKGEHTHPCPVPLVHPLVV